MSARGVDFYSMPERYPELFYERTEIEALFRHLLSDAVFPAKAVKTRAKEAKLAACGALGYPVPRAFKKVKPQFPAQDLEVKAYQRDNFQVYNEPLDPTRRFAIFRLDGEGHVLALRVVEGAVLAALDKTGKLTSKYQACRIKGRDASRLVSPEDTRSFIDVLAPTDRLDEGALVTLSPVSPPVRGKVLAVRAIYERLQELVGCELEYSPSERIRGERLHRLVCEILGLGSYADTGHFPDIVCQALEVKLQTAATIDLGRTAPDSPDVALTLSPRLRHRDARYLIAYAVREGDVLRITNIVVSSGDAFFSEFRWVGEGRKNDKLQLTLPRDFFEPEQLGDGNVQCRLDLG